MLAFHLRKVVFRYIDTYTGRITKVGCSACRLFVALFSVPQLGNYMVSAFFGEGFSHSDSSSLSLQKAMARTEYHLRLYYYDRRPKSLIIISHRC